MAQCPNCGTKLHLWNMKAECPHCGANIPNHDWEGRLEEDALAREKAFYQMHSTLNKLKFSVVGTKTRIARLACAFLPILGYVVPLGAINYVCKDGTVFAADPINAIALFTKNSFKFTDILSKIMGGFDLGNSAIMAFAMLLLSLLFGVLAFFSIPVIFSKFKQPVTAIFHVISIICYALAAFKLNSLGGDIASVGWGVYIGLALFVAALVVDIIVLTQKIDPLAGKYIPKGDELQIEYAKSIGELYDDSALKSEESPSEETTEKEEE